MLLVLSNILLVPMLKANAVEELLISAPTNRLMNGKFIDESLGEQLKPAGKLGQIFLLTPKAKIVFLVDMSTLEEIVDMSDGYTLNNEVAGINNMVAKNWLDRFRQVSNSNNSVSISYGNPSKEWIEKLFKDENEYYQSVNKIRLEEFLGKSVKLNSLPNEKQMQLPKEAITSFVSADTQLRILSSIVNPKELAAQRLRLAQLLNPGIDAKNIPIFYADFNKSMSEVRNKLRVASTKFTVTNEKQKLPITLVNGFESDVKLKMVAKPTNLKVGTRSVGEIELPANSKKQVLLPIDVFASGTSALQVQLTDLDGKAIGYPVYISLNLTVISTTTTWLTSIAALLLLIGVITQSVRRFKSNKGEELPAPKSLVAKGKGISRG